VRTRSLLHSFGCAFAGLGYVLRTERNTWIQLALDALVIAVAAWLNLSLLEWAVLLLTLGVLFAAEVGNTALERLVDLASPDYHELARAAKDAAAGAVLAVALTTIAVCLLVLGPPLFARVLG
jgi:diacylglycerol kinase